MQSSSLRTADHHSARPDAGLASEQIDAGPIAPLLRNYLRSRLDLVPQLDNLAIVSTSGDEPPLQVSAVRNLLEEDLGRSVDGVFAWIDPVPLRAGPLAQLHLARTVGGREVAIKLRRPDADAAVSRMLAGIEPAMRAVGRLAQLSAPAVSDFEQGFRAWLDVELDGRGELTNLQHLYAGGADHEVVAVSRPHVNLSGPRTVVFDTSRGVPLDEVAHRPHESAPGQSDQLLLGGVEVANNLVRAILQQIFLGEIYLSGLAPDNIVALPDNRVAFLDFSHVDRIDPIIRKNQFRFVAAVAAADTERILSAINDLAESPSNEASEAFAIAFRRQMNSWEHDQKSRGAPGEHLAEYLKETLRLARHHDLRLENSVLSMVRAMLAVDQIAKRLSARSGIGVVAPAFFAPKWLSSLARELLQERLPTLGFDLLDLLTDGPGNLVRVLSDIADRRFVLRVQTVESEESRGAAATRVRLLAASGIFVGICVLNAALWNDDGVPGFIRFAFAGLGITSLLTIGVLWRRLG